MKKMIKFGALMVAMLIIGFSCTKKELIDFDNLNPQNDGVLKISVSGGPLGSQVKSTSSMGDTINIEGGNVYNFAFTSTIEMTSVQWTFHNNNTTSQEKMPSNRYERIFTVSSVTLVGVDINGNAHQAQVWLNNLPRVGGPPILWKGKVLLAPGLYQEEFWAYKNGAYMTPADYRIKGNITTPPWQTLLTIPPVDTNYRMENGQLYIMPGGENGHWVKMFLNCSINFDVEVAPLIRVTTNLGEQWASFKGSQYVNANNYGLMRFHVDGNGDVTASGGNNATMPGLGDDAYLRFGINNDTSLIIYQNNEQAFNSISPWIQFKENDSWATPLHSTYAVPDFPNWSKFTVSVSSLPLRARFGSNITNPISNSNNVNSIYYDVIYRDLFIDVAIVPAKNSGGGYTLIIRKPKD